MLKPQAKIELWNISQQFIRPDGATVPVLTPISLAIPAGRFVTLIGPSGCGKTTVFNVIAGLQEPTTGAVLIDGQEATGMVGHVGYMLQKDLLFPWRTVLDNVVLGMEIRGANKRAAREYALGFIHKYGLGGFEYQYPSTLSGGMRQRAALLRTLLFDSEIILLDEPFGALDAQTRARMQEWLLQLWSDFRKTVVFITHDVEEAVYLSDEIYVMSARPGRIVSHLDVTLPRPRPRHITLDAEFVELKERCLGFLGHEPPAAQAA